MNNDTLLAVGFVLYMLLTGMFWFLRSYLRHETERFANSQKALTEKAALRLVNVTSGYVIARTMWAMATTLAALTFGDVIAVDAIKNWITPFFPSWCIASFCILSLAAFARLVALCWPGIKINWDVILHNKEES